MPTAFVMIQAEPSKIPTIAQTIANMAEGAEVYSVTGDHDIIVIFRTSQYEELAHAVPEQVAQIDGVIKTNTILAFRQFSAEEVQEGWDIGVT